MRRFILLKIIHDIV